MRDAQREADIMAGRWRPHRYGARAPQKKPGAEKRIPLLAWTWDSPPGFRPVNPHPINIQYYRPTVTE